MNRTNLKATLLMVALTAIACGQESTPDAEQTGELAVREDGLSSNKALILGSTVSGGNTSIEYLAVKKLGISDLNITVATNEQWASMTAAQFATYRVIVLGDAGCASLDAVSAAVANRNVWASAISGNIYIMGTAPVANNAPVDVTDKGIKFAAAQIGQTGLYVSLSCYYQSAAPNTPVELLSPFGSFMVQGGGCYNTAHVVGTHTSLSTVTDAALSNWPCSVGTQFDSFPQANFAPYAIAKYPPSIRPDGTNYFDGTYGSPYILARGTKLIGCGNGVVNPGEECDYGTEANGLSGSSCSATCRFHWCGDGIQDAGEECDLGSANGGSLCSKMCRIPGGGTPPPPANRPPVASCRPMQVSAGLTCGGVGADVNNGSSDPDGNLVGCVQSVTSFELGETLVTLTCTDAQGLSASCSSTVKVVDDITPSISCPAASSFECGGAPAQLAAPQAQDNCTSPMLSSEMSGEGYALGSPRTVTWKATDGANEAACSTSVTMVDTLAPSLSLNGGATQQAECGVPGSYAEAGVVATDKCQGDLSGNVAISGQVDVSKLGTYPITYSVADQVGNSASAVRQVKVADTQAPALALLGAAAVGLECGVGKYTEAGVVANDVCAGNLNTSVAISGAVDEKATGSYALTYSVADASGNVASAVRTVNVQDTLAPSIALVGAAAMQLECGVDSFSNPGATATDACSGSLAVDISGSVDTAKTGDYTVSYSAVDGAGLSASASRAVKVADTKAPALTLNGASALALECGVGSYTEAGASAVDACTGNLSGLVSISGSVNAAVKGTYTKTYSVTDASGNVASAARTVEVKDTLAPSIALVGAATMQLECGVDSFVNPGAAAVDACSGSLAVISSGSVDTAKTGSYPVSYSAVDGAGLAASAVRTVKVADTKAPALTLNGAASVDVECGVGSYTEAGATAADVCTGNLSNEVAISGTVNAAVKGIYTKTYSVTDASGNSASAARTVNVKDTKAPSISLVGAAVMSVNKGSTFVDPGATAADACTTNLTISKTGSVDTAVAGTYTLNYSVTDGAGLSASVSRTVNVVNAGNSCGTTVTVKPTQQIWPPNHKYQTFSLSDCATATTSSECGGGGCHGANINTMGTILSIYSDEVEDAQGNGDGSTLDDIVITGPSTFKLRAERQGKGNGRVYGVTFKVTDSSGFEQTATCKFAVPHDQSGRGVIDEGAAAGYTVFAQ